MDGLVNLQNVLVVGMTNRKELLDEALLRPGRMEVNPQRLRLLFFSQSRMEVVPLVIAIARVFCRPISRVDGDLKDSIVHKKSLSDALFIWDKMRVLDFLLLGLVPTLVFVSRRLSRELSWPTTAITSANTPGGDARYFVVGRQTPL